MSTNPYAQVALTYIRRPFSSWKIGVLFGGTFLGFLLTAALSRIDDRQNFAMQQLLPFAALFVFLMVHAKDQFADSRAHLMPDFRRVHAVVAASMAVVCVVLLPALFSWCLDWHSIGFVALAVLLFGTILWMILLMSGWFLWLALLGWAPLCTGPGREWVQRVVTGNQEPLAAAILAIGAAITVLGGIRLFGLNEDMAEYRWMKWDRSNGRTELIGPRYVDDPLTRRLKEWLGEREMARLTRHARQAPVSWWSRICRWQVGMTPGSSLWILILCAVLLNQVFASLMRREQPQAQQMSQFLTAMVYFVLTMMPVSTMMGIAVKIPMLGFESLLPVTRKTFLRQVGAAFALSLLQLWGGISLALGLWWLLDGPGPLQFGMFTGVVAFSAVFQVVIFGVVVWVARYRSRWLDVLALMMIFPVPQMFQLRWSISRPGQLPEYALWITGVVALLGLLITFDAYRRWLRADFD